MKYIKRFTEWINVKQKIDDEDRTILNFSERDVWMCHFGENVGFESCGRNESFHRPVIVLHKFGAYTFYAIPLSTKVKKENRYYIDVELGGVLQSAMISQMRLLDVRRLHYRKGQVSEADFVKVKESFLALFNEITPQKRGAHKGDL